MGTGGDKHVFLNPGGLCSIHHPGSYHDHSTYGKIEASWTLLQQEQECLVHCVSVCQYSGAEPQLC